MRVVRFTSSGVTDGIHLLDPISLAADRSVAVAHGRELHLYDLQGSETPVARISDVVGHALAPTCLIVADTSGDLTRWKLREGKWEPATSFSSPADAGAEPKLPTHLLLSPSGRYLLVEAAPIAGAASKWAVSRAYLLDALTGEVKRAFDLHLSWVRAAFVSLPLGEEALFISAESYMSVQFVACSSGQALHGYTATTSWITPEEPSEAVSTSRQSDAALSSASEQSGSFPLPMVFCQPEVFDADVVLPWQLTETQDGTVTSVALVDLAKLPAAGTEVSDELLSEMRQTDRAIYDQLCQLPSRGSGVVIRRVNPTNGEVVGWSVVTGGKTDERHVHALPNHRVLLVNEHIEIVDGLTGVVSDEGPLDVPVRWFYTVPTSSGETLIVYWSEMAS